MLFERGVQIGIAGAAGLKIAIELVRRALLAMPVLVFFQRSLDDGGNGSAFATGQAIGQFSRLGAAHGQLWFGHGGLVDLGKWSASISAILPANDGWLATVSDTTASSALQASLLGQQS